MTPEELKFWQDIYYACIRRGEYNEFARATANTALYHMRTTK